MSKMLKIGDTVYDVDEIQSLKARTEALPDGDDIKFYACVRVLLRHRVGYECEEIDLGKDHDAATRWCHRTLYEFATKKDQGSRG